MIDDRDGRWRVPNIAGDWWVDLVEVRREQVVKGWIIPKERATTGIVIHKIKSGVFCIETPDIRL